MTVALMRSRLFAVIDAVSGTGNGYDYERWVNSYDSLLNLFKENNEIRGFHIAYRGYSVSERASIQRAEFRDHRWVTYVYLGHDDARETEKAFSDLVEAIVNDIQDNSPLTGFYETSVPTATVNLTMFGSVFCHVAEITTTITEIRERA